MMEECGDEESTLSKYEYWSFTVSIESLFSIRPFLIGGGLRKRKTAFFVILKKRFFFRRVPPYR